MEYSHRAIEKKWQKYWSENKTFKTATKYNRKSYVLDMFPYPSGQGLHVGHPKGYTATDVYARFKRMNQFNVLHPIGWDAFGLPAEQYALKTGNLPNEFTNKNIDNFRKQLKKLGFSYDYDREINTSNPAYYKTTQFIFTKLYEYGLAELKSIDVNWCPQLGTVLANEEIITKDGKMLSERGEFPVVKKAMKQWVLKITKYADKLLTGLNELDWPQSVKQLQRNWIGKKSGVKLLFPLTDCKDKLEIFTTRIDTLFGVSYLAIAPEKVEQLKITNKNKLVEIQQFINKIKSQTELERENSSRPKTGLFSGKYALHPITKIKLPIWISDYVLPTYATGIVMGVPGHDLRDYEFAKKYQLKIIYIIENPYDSKVVINDGKHINSKFINGMYIDDAKRALLKYLVTHKIGSVKTYYKLRDWIFSRQRYWGEPFPIIYWDDNKISLVNKTDLPLILPITDKITPSQDGKSPLANCKKWLTVQNQDGRIGQRETNTMPQWAGSCWYYLAYILVNEDGSIKDLTSKEAFKDFKKWLPVDIYIGGQEHAVLHLLYARFWHHFLYDIGILPIKEPFQRLINQGMVLGPDGNKMSKSKGNVINPDQIILSHGADSLRLYEMFMGPLNASLSWDFNGLDGTRKWLDRIYRFYNKKTITPKNNKSLDSIYNSSVMQISDLIEKMSLNIVISKLMNLLNHFYRSQEVYLQYFEGFIKMVSLFAPHLAEEIWSQLGHSNSISYEKWPTFTKQLIQDEANKFLIVQVNGKIKTKVILSNLKSLDKNAIIKIIKKDPKIQSILVNKKILKTIFVPHKILNFVTD